MESIITLVIKLVITVIGVVVAKYVIPYLKNALGEQTLENIKSWAKTIVKCAEMIYTEQGSGESKLAYATELLNKVISNYGVSYTEEEIRSIIEDAVYQLNNGSEE